MQLIGKKQTFSMQIKLHNYNDTYFNTTHASQGENEIGPKTFTSKAE